MAIPTLVGDSTEGICDMKIPDCCSHSRSGTNSTGSPDVRIGGKQVHLVGDEGSCNCPHGGTFESVAGSSSVRINGKKIACVGDETVCLSCGKSGTHVTGASDVRIGT